MNRQRHHHADEESFFDRDRRREGPGLRRAIRSGIFLRAGEERLTGRSLDPGEGTAPGASQAREEPIYLRWRPSAGAIPMLIFVRDTGVIVAANQAAVRAYGWSHEELLGSTVSALAPPRDPVVHALMHCHHVQTTWTAPLRQLRKDGTTFLAELGMLEAEETSSATIMIVARVPDPRPEEQLC